jgi:drug/metabolite transporter (DMT)-like permease
VIVLLQVQPLLVLILSFIFLDEVISQLQLVGFFLILGASLGMTITRHGTDYQFSMGTFLTVMTLNLGISSTAVLYKFVVEDHRFLDTVAYEAMGNGLGGIMLFVFSGTIRNAFLTTLRVMRRRALGIIFVNEGFVQIAKSTGLRAVSLGPVALVRVIGSTQVFTGILIGWLLTVMVSSVYHEDISQQNLTRKLGLATVMFGGVVLLIT